MATETPRLPPLSPRLLFCNTSHARGEQLLSAFRRKSRKNFKSYENFSFVAADFAEKRLFCEKFPAFSGIFLPSSDEDCFGGDATCPCSDKDGDGYGSPGASTCTVRFG
ncbi:hypothetical protein HYV85_04825 [Candidatus Woesearchaeota archaeon]|nr:hypothetical protein [Candidatus Woesearchaeota archaeon]